MIGLVERAGTGIPRIRQACRSLNLPEPVFTEDYDPERVTASISFRRSSDVGDLGHRILELISSDDRISLDGMTAILGESKSAVVRTVNALKAEGMLRREGGTRGRWVILGDAETPDDQRPASPSLGTLSCEHKFRHKFYAHASIEMGVRTYVPTYVGKGASACDSISRNMRPNICWRHKFIAAAYVRT